MDRTKFLPMEKMDMKALGWTELDFVLISGDAYIDHPSFGAALIGRVLLAEGYRVGIISQPDWKKKESFQKLGKPRLAFLISSGNIDSMINHYTAAKKARQSDNYSPGGKKGRRPDRALIVYANKAREAFKDVPIIIGGIEASLRRFAHYDYWENRVRRSILFDAKADLLIYGMGERQITAIARALDKGKSIHELDNIPGTCYIADQFPIDKEYIKTFAYEEVEEDKRKFAKSFMQQYNEQNPFLGKTVVQAHGNRYLIQLPPAKPLTEKELDEVYGLPFQRKYHPTYEKEGGVPAFQEVKFSITSHRGCYGGCSFCALNFHQGRIIQSRSHDSVIREAEILTQLPDFKGYINDVGGPTANFREPACSLQMKKGPCQHRQCLFPEPCSNLKIDHSDYLQLLRTLRKLPKIKKVFIRSGIRYDYLLLDKKDEFFHELCCNHISGQLKVAPEHVSPKVLQMMGKPKRQVYDKFVDKFKKINEKLNKKQYLVPYFISSHPGSTLKDAVMLAEYIRDMGYNPEQVQDFIPTPGSLSTAMYYTGLDPRTMKKIYIPRTPKEKAMQRALLQYRDPKNFQLVYDALLSVGRKDLIGYGPQALIKPPEEKKKKSNDKKRKKSKIIKGKTKKYKEKYIKQ